MIFSPAGPETNRFRVCGQFAVPVPVSTLVNRVEQTGDRVVMIIDEWDAPIRETPEIEKEYL